MMQELLAAVAVVGPWKYFQRDVNSEEAIQVILKEAHIYSDENYGKDYYWVTLSIQTGFCRYVANYCRKHDIRLISIDSIPIHFLPKVDGQMIPFGSIDDLGNIFRSRHAALMELVDCFFIKCCHRTTIIDDLIERVKASDKPYFIYSEENTILEYKGDPKVHAQRKAER